MKGTKKKKYFFPTAKWFQDQTNDFEERWANAPWHEKGEKKLKPILNSIRKYASFINQLPENFLPRVFDQHLAVLSEGYEYHILDILDDLGDDSYLCKNNEGIYFCVWSHGITQNYTEGIRTVMLALIPLGNKSVLPDTNEEEHKIEDYIPAITYGPILSWKGLFSSDFSLMAKELSRDLFKLKGLSAVIQFNPVPFWALWTLSGIPIAMHKTEEFATIWIEGRFIEDPASVLTTGWKSTKLGKRIRLKKPGSKLFFEQILVYDNKTMQGIILTRRESYFKKLYASLENIFVPNTERATFVSLNCEMAMMDILRITPSYHSWLDPFEKFDEEKSKAKGDNSPESKQNLDTINAVLQDLLPFINSGQKPNFAELAQKHSLDSLEQENVKHMYEQLLKKFPIKR